MAISLQRVWLNLILAPVWFLVFIILLSVYFSSQGVAEAEIPAAVTAHTPLIILLVQITILLFLLGTSRKDQIRLFTQGWQTPSGQSLAKEIAYGVLTGAGIAALYFTLLSPVHIFLQTSLGDYVPPGETTQVLGNVGLAPLVEESLYRNYARIQLAKKYTNAQTIAITTLVFGLLHWFGGFWYMLITALFVGLPFAFIADRRQSVIWVFTAHLTLNLIEYIILTV
jgi:uncharacterized protein